MIWSVGEDIKEDMGVGFRPRLEPRIGAPGSKTMVAENCHESDESRGLA